MTRTSLLSAACLLSLAVGCAQTATTSYAPSAAQQGYVAYRAGDLNGAENGFRSALSQDPGDAYAMIGLGAVSERRGDLSGAANYYSQAESAGRGSIAMQAYDTQTGAIMNHQVGLSELAAQNLDRIHRNTAYRESVYTSSASFASYDGGSASYAATDTAYYADPAATAPVTETLYYEPTAQTPVSTGYAVAAQDSQVTYRVAAAAPVETYQPAMERITIEPASYTETVSYETAVYSAPQAGAYDYSNYESIGALDSAMQPIDPVYETAAVNYSDTVAVQSYESGPIASAYDPGTTTYDNAMYDAQPSATGGQYMAIGDATSAHVGISAEGYGDATPVISAEQGSYALHGTVGADSNGLIYLGQ